MLAQPSVPADLANSISDRLRFEAEAVRRRAEERPLSLVARWLRPRVMPYTVGAFASVLLFFCMFNALRPHLMALRDWQVASREADVSSYKVLYVQGGKEGGPDLTEPVSADTFTFASPSLNPNGALAALTWASSHNHGRADDMVVLTDVFSNGNASLAGVVQPPHDRRMLEDFQDALRKSPAFVPASYDRRPETMRIVFVVQKVSVREHSF